MLRTVTSVCHRAYTCSCMLKVMGQVRQATRTPGIMCQVQQIHSSLAVSTLDKDVRAKKAAIKLSHESKQEQLDGDTEVELQGLTAAGITIPTLETHAMLIDGVRYDELPIVHIKSSPNNTIISVTDYTGKNPIAKASCGTEGFRNVKKSTNVAAQATGLSAGTKAVRKGVKNVRVAVKGIGAGRLPAIKGLVQSGLNVVSLTDTTPLLCDMRRPRKAKRI